MKLVAAILCVSGVVFLLNHKFPYVFENPDNYIAIVPLIVILISLIVYIFSNKVNVKVVVTNFMVWAIIFTLCITGYSYRYELQDVYSHVMGSLLPSDGQVNTDSSVTFRKSMDGHFIIKAQVNNENIYFLLDTGASKVTLSRRDAQRLGYDLKKLVYNIRMNTANGINLAAYVRLDELKVGDIVVKNIDAYVNKSGLDSSLLGMNFLNRLSKYEVKKGEVTFYGTQ